MSDFPVQYDADERTIRLNGKGGASVMLTFLLTASSSATMAWLNAASAFR